LQRSAGRPSSAHDSGDVLGILEAAYSIDVSDEQWLADIADAALPIFDDGFGLSAFRFRSGAEPFEVIQQHRGSLPEVLQHIYGSLFLAAAQGLFQRASLLGPVVVASQLLSVRDDANQELIRAFDAVGIRDSLLITAAEPSGLGCGFHVGRSRIEHPSPSQVRRWERIAAHIATAVRLRHRLKLASESGSAGGVLLEPNGRLHHTSEPVAGEDREELRRAVLSVEASRSAMRSKNLDQSLARWPTLTAGRWSLADQVERDGRRFIVAVENAPHVPGTTLLTNRERAMVNCAQRGLSNTQIAHQFGVSLSTVTVLLHRAMTKLGVRTRAELLAIGNAERQGRTTESASPNQLSERELQALDLRVRGHSMYSIASELGVSRVTAEVILQRASKKLAATARVEIDKPGRQDSSLESLTEKERQVVGYAKLGHHNKLIAYELGLSPSTVRVLLSRVATKLGVRTRSEIIAAVRPDTEPPSPD
jgi:DNA-binding NarL/FixJ family response regulator